MDAPTFSAGGLTISPPTTDGALMNVLLWGDSGSGKTTLAATAPGRKLFVMLDPGGGLSLTAREDIDQLDLSAESSIKLMSQFRTVDPYSLTMFLRTHLDIETVVLDSATALAYAALQEAVTKAGGKSTMEQPGMHGYTYRNGSILRVVTAIMRMCALERRHLIVITHEGNADRNEDGVVLSVTMALSDSVANQVGLRFNEVWHVSDTGKERRIAVRPCRLRKPMKTRLFTATEPEFVWHYDPDTQVGEGITDWYRAWQVGGGKKLPMPIRVTTTSGGANKK